IGADPSDPELVRLLEFWTTPPQTSNMGDVSLVFADENYHETLAIASGSRVFPAMIRNINQRLHALRIRDFVDPDRVWRTYDQHAEILRCLQAGDQRLAQALLQAHIWESHRFVRSSAERARADDTFPLLDPPSDVNGAPDTGLLKLLRPRGQRET
ncbi:MAG: FCD domain-containing protein, partial [Chloroflexi bacterium]|nr:FCD domain-containing protein [Chloroflexota bacterium]